MPAPLLLAHVMAWYAAKPVSGVWGWHWTMNRFDPEKTGPDGQREAASHDRPAIGLYDSGDPLALQCQVQQMRLAGIDGVIVDWYGTEPYLDYAEIHRNTERLLAVVKRAGLRYAICYEDQSVKHLREGGRIPADQEVAQGRKALGWLDRNAFPDPAYVTVDGRPLLLVFGPQHFEKPQWQALREGLQRNPVLVGLPHLTARGMDGAFGWPPVSGGREIPPDTWRAYLRDLAARRAAGQTVVAVAFPGFHDIYKEAGLHDSYGAIDPRDGKTLQETLELARKSGAPVVQIATWNDYGEGTMVEPTTGNGYRNLEAVQRFARSLPGRTLTATPEDLRLPARLLSLRRRDISPAAKADLDRASERLLKGQIRDVRRLMGRWERA